MNTASGHREHIVTYVDTPVVMRTRNVKKYDNTHTGEICVKVDGFEYPVTRK